MTTSHDMQFHMPQGPNLDGLTGQHIAAVEAAKGLEALPHMAEIWPLGGEAACRTAKSELIS